MSVPEPVHAASATATADPDARTGGSEPDPLVRRAAAWLALGTIAILVIAIARPENPGHLDVSGPWSTDSGPVELPGIFGRRGGDPEGRTVLERSVVATEPDNAVYLESPAYAVDVLWDGRPVGGTGDPSSAETSDRSLRSVRVTIPTAQPGTVHRLTLDVRGAYGKAGLTGRILFGPASEVHAVAGRAEMQRLALALGLCLLASLPLAVSVRGAWRPAYLAYGAFVTSVAALLFAATDLCAHWLPDPTGVITLRRTAEPLTATFGVWFVESFVGGAPSRTAQALIGAGWVLVAVGAALAQTPWMYTTEQIQDAFLLVCGTWFAVVAVRGWRDGARGGAFLLASMVPVLATPLSEVLLTHGLRTGGSAAPLGALSFAVTLGAALVIRDADQAEEHEQLVRSSLDAMVTVDRLGRILGANPAAVRLLGAVAPGTSFLSGVADPDQPVVRAHLDRAVTRADRAEFRTTGDRVIESLATPLSRDLRILTLRDITVRREIERSMLKSARMDTAGLLLGGIAHDFNNMLGTLLAHLGLLRMQLQEARFRDRIERMESTVERASELTRRLLTVARGTGSQLEAVDMVKICRDAAELAEPTFPKEVRFDVDLPPELPPVLGAAPDLEQVLVNLLVNARDAVTGRGGRVRLAARAFQVRGRNAGVVVMVEDDGAGVPADRREEIFEPFVTSKAHGTGLGLAVARQIVRDHYGRVWVEPRPGGGARFLLALRHADAVDEAPARLPRGRRVLVVEDEAILREAHVEALRAAGYDVEAVESSTEAVHHLQTRPLDVLVTDVRMPGFHGIELARLCRQLHPSVPILFVSAFVPEPSVHEFEEGTWGALHKPVRAARLVATVGHLRRRAERVADGTEGVTDVSYAFPDLDQLTSAAVGL